MKHKFVVTGTILVSFLLQSTVFQTLSLGSICPNLMVVVTSSFGFMKGKKEGLGVGFFCGLLEDDIKLPIFLIAVSELVYGLGTYVIMFMMRSRFAFAYYMIRIIFPELLYTIVVTLVFYRVIYAVNRKMEDEE